MDWDIWYLQSKVVGIKNLICDKGHSLHAISIAQTITVCKHIFLVIRNLPFKPKFHVSY